MYIEVLTAFPCRGNQRTRWCVVLVGVFGAVASALVWTAIDLFNPFPVRVRGEPVAIFGRSRGRHMTLSGPGADPKAVR